MAKKQTSRKNVHRPDPVIPACGTPAVLQLVRPVGFLPPCCHRTCHCRRLVLREHVLQFTRATGARESARTCCHVCLPFLALAKPPQRPEPPTPFFCFSMTVQCLSLEHLSSGQRPARSILRGCVQHCCSCVGSMACHTVRRGAGGGKFTDVPVVLSSTTD